MKMFKSSFMKYGYWDSFCYSTIPKLMSDACSISSDYKEYCTWFTYLHLTVEVTSQTVSLSLYLTSKS